MSEIEPKSEEEWYSILKEKREELRELVLDDSGRLVSREELIDKLDDIGIEVSEDESGTIHYTDRTLEERVEESDDGCVTAKTAKLPVTRADVLVRSGTHPDELDSVRAEAERMAEFDASVTPVLEKQAEEGDFPLEYPRREE